MQVEVRKAATLSVFKQKLDSIRPTYFQNLSQCSSNYSDSLQYLAIGGLFYCELSVYLSCLLTEHFQWLCTAIRPIQLIELDCTDPYRAILIDFKWNKWFCVSCEPVYFMSERSAQKVMPTIFEI